MIREADIDELVTALRDGDAAALGAIGARVGLAFELTALQRFAAAIAGTIGMRSLLATLLEALETEAGIAIHHHGGIPRSLCLAVVSGDHVTVGVRAVQDRTAVPSDAWPSLRPWFQDLAKNAKRVAKWAVIVSPDRIRIPIVARRDATDEHALMRQIVERPHDRELRLVLADLLMAREDVRGRLIQLEHEASALPPGKQRHALEAAAARIVGDHGARLAGEIATLASSYTLAGGFVDIVQMTVANYVRHGERLFSLQPIRVLRPKQPDTAALEKLAKAPHFPHLRGLELHASKPYRRLALSLAPFDDVELSLEELSLEDVDLHDSVASLRTPELRRLRLHDVHFATSWLASLLANKVATAALEELVIEEIPHIPGSPELDQALFACRFPALRVLRLHHSRCLTDEQTRRLIAHAPELQVIELGLASTEACAEIASHPEVVDVALWNGDLDLETLDALLAAPKLRTLRLHSRASTDRRHDRLIDRLLALPASHPLREVSMLDQGRLAKRFGEPERD